MKKITTLTLGALSLVALASACNVEVEAPQEEGSIGTTEEALTCGNESAVNSVLAGMATDAALDMGRWLPDRDFVFTPTNDLTKMPLQLSSWGRAKCPTLPGTTTKVCTRLNASLQYQLGTMDGVIIGGEPLNVGVLRSRMAAYWNAQMVCINRPDNNAGDNCPWQQHDLKFDPMTGKSQGTCGKDYTFTAFVGNTTPRYSQNLAVPAQLQNMLIWAGHPNNPFLAFKSAGQLVTIDPPVEPPPPDGGGSGACEQLTQYSSGLCQAVLNASVPENVRTLGNCCKCGTGPSMSWQWRAGVTPGTFYHCK